MDAKPSLRVAAGILHDRQNRVLISERLGDSGWAGLWEFPGGKLSASESPAEALCRELGEELGIAVLRHDHFMRLDHDYPDRFVSIDFFIVDAWQGQPCGLEGQALKWVAIERLDEALLLPADVSVIRALKARRAL